MIRTNFKSISDKYDLSLVEAGFAAFKPQGPYAAELDKHGVDLIGLQGQRVDMKWPETIENFYFQASKILNDSYTWTEEYWYAYHGLVYKFRREELKAFVEMHRSQWTGRRFSDGYEEQVLYLASISGIGEAKPFEVAPLPAYTARLVEANVLAKRQVYPSGLKEWSLIKWAELARRGQAYKQNYCCEPGSLCSDGCFRFWKFQEQNGSYARTNSYYKIGAETAERLRRVNRNVLVIPREAVAANSCEYYMN